MKQMSLNGQMMLDLGEINPLREVAKTASTYWEKSKDKLRELFSQNPDGYDWTVSVRHEYCPYEIAGRWGFGAGPNTIEGYSMSCQGVRVVYYDLGGREREIRRSWQDFAKEIWLLIQGGEYE